MHFASVSKVLQLRLILQVYIWIFSLVLNAPGVGCIIRTAILPKPHSLLIPPEPQTLGPGRRALRGVTERLSKGTQHTHKT